MSDRDRVGLRLIAAQWGMAILLTVAAPVAADPPTIFRPDPNAATSSREAEAAAIKALPVDKLDEQGRAKVAAVVSNVTVFRRMPVQVIQCDPELYLFCVRHPDVVVNIWQTLGVTQLKMRQTGPNTYHVIDGAGTECTVYCLYRSSDLNLFYAEGTYEGPLFSKKVHGRGLVALRTAYTREPDGRQFITNRLDTFLQLEPGALELFSRTFQPLIGRVADNNFVQTTTFVASLSKTAEVNSRGVQRLASKLEAVQPEVRQGFAETAMRVAERAASSAQAPAKVASRPGEEPKR